MTVLYIMALVYYLLLLGVATSPILPPIAREQLKLMNFIRDVGLTEASKLWQRWVYLLLICQDVHLEFSSV